MSISKNDRIESHWKVEFIGKWGLIKGIENLGEVGVDCIASSFFRSESSRHFFELISDS